MKTFIVAGLLIATPAWAQQPPPQTQKDSPLPASAGRGTDVPGGSATNGVITPPTMTDPGIAKPPPQNGTMPVIKPPPAARPGTVPK